MKSKRARFKYRRERTRGHLAARGAGRPRLSVRRSLRYLYAQIIDDSQGRTLASATSLPPEGRGKSAKSLVAAKAVGELIAQRALAAGVKKVAFDRGAYRYHGRVKALAEAARAGGLEF